MTDPIQVIKEYINTPEGAEWFMIAVKEAQKQMQVSEELSHNHTPREEDLTNQSENPVELIPNKRERALKQLMVSKRDLENVIEWIEHHPNPERDGRYILRVNPSGGGRLSLKSTLLMKGESVSNSQIVTDDPKKMLVGEISRVSTKSGHIETYDIVLTD